MTRSVFGWDYPPGAEHDPMAPYNQVILAPIEKLAVELDRLLEEAAGWAHETNK